VRQRRGEAVQVLDRAVPDRPGGAGRLEVRVQSDEHRRQPDEAVEAGDQLGICVICTRAATMAPATPPIATISTISQVALTLGARMVASPACLTLHLGWVGSQVERFRRRSVPPGSSPQSEDECRISIDRPAARSRPQSS